MKNLNGPSIIYVFLHYEIIQVDGHLFINTVSEVINDERFYNDAIHVQGVA